MDLLLNESQLAGSAVRRESYGIEILLPHLLQQLQTACLAAAPVSRSAGAFLRHPLHQNKRINNHESSAILLPADSRSRSNNTTASVVSQRALFMRPTRSFLFLFFSFSHFPLEKQYASYIISMYAKRRPLSD